MNPLRRAIKSKGMYEYFLGSIRSADTPSARAAFSLRITRMYRLEGSYRHAEQALLAWRQTRKREPDGRQASLTDPLPIARRRSSDGPSPTRSPSLRRASDRIPWSLGALGASPCPAIPPVRRYPMSNGLERRLPAAVIAPAKGGTGAIEVEP